MTGRVPSKPFPPAPDITVAYGDHQLYVEHAMILDDVAMAVDVAIEDANFALHDAAALNPPWRTFLLAAS